ncbi:protein NATD1-like [Ciona intestinalis]
MLSRSVARNLRKMSNFPQKSLKVEHDVANKEFFVKIPGCNERAYLSYREIGEGSVDLEHTVVPESFRGQGIGQILAKTALDNMVAKGMKMKLTCWYLQKYVKENPSDDYKHLVI